MNWTSFWTGVAVTVVGGLILFVIIGGPRWFLAWRKKGALEADRAYTERTPIRVGGHIVAEEIRANANIALRCEEGHHVPSEARRLTALPGQLQPRITRASSSSPN